MFVKNYIASKSGAYKKFVQEERKLKDREGADVSSGDDCGSMYSVPLLFLPSALDANECTRMHSCSLMVQVQSSSSGEKESFQPI